LARGSSCNLRKPGRGFSAMTFNFILALTGGLLAAYVVSKGDAFWTYSGGLAALVATSAGSDLYHPLQALLIGAAAAYLAYRLHHWVERCFRIDDAVGAVAVHGYAGMFGVIVAGFVLWGYPTSMNPDYASIAPWAQLAGAAVCFLLLGFLPAWIVAGILNCLDLLRVPAAIEIAGLDFAIDNASGEAAEEISAFERDLATRLDGR
jgi:Amt family ammonium transporter